MVQLWSPTNTSNDKCMLSTEESAEHPFGHGGVGESTQQTQTLNTEEKKLKKILLVPKEENKIKDFPNILRFLATAKNLSVLNAPFPPFAVK